MNMAMKCCLFFIDARDREILSECERIEIKQPIHISIRQIIYERLISVVDI